MRGCSGKSGSRNLLTRERELYATRDDLILTSVETTLPVASKSLARTGFDAWQIAFIGAVCLAGSALLLRRTRRG